MNTCIVGIFVSLRVISRSETARPYGMDTFNFIRAAKLFLEVAPFASLPAVHEVSALESRPPLGSFEVGILAGNDDNDALICHLLCREASVHVFGAGT